MEKSVILPTHSKVDELIMKKKRSSTPTHHSKTIWSPFMAPLLQYTVRPFLLPGYKEKGKNNRI